jgi:hypothetical protein
MSPTLHPLRCSSRGKILMFPPLYGEIWGPDFLESGGCPRTHMRFQKTKGVNPKP